MGTGVVAVNGIPPTNRYVRGDLEATALHPVQRFHQVGLDRDRFFTVAFDIMRKVLQQV
jgi:hypothetical protein